MLRVFDFQIAAKRDVEEPNDKIKDPHGLSLPLQ